MQTAPVVSDSWARNFASDSGSPPRKPPPWMSKCSGRKPGRSLQGGGLKTIARSRRPVRVGR